MQGPTYLDEQGNPIRLDDNGEPIVPSQHDIRMPQWAPDWVPAPTIPQSGEVVRNLGQPQTDIRFTPSPNDTGPAFINDIIRPRLHQLAGIEPGPLNPDPNKNPLMNQPFFPNIEEPVGQPEDVRHLIGRHAWNFINQNLFTPVGVYGGLLDAHTPTDPIPNPREATGFIGDLVNQLDQHVATQRAHEIVEGYKPPLGLKPAPFVGGQMGVAEPHTYPLDFGTSGPQDISFRPRNRPFNAKKGMLVEDATPNPEEIVQVPPEIAAEYGTGLGRPIAETYKAPYYPAPKGEKGPALLGPKQKTYLNENGEPIQPDLDFQEPQAARTEGGGVKIGADVRSLGKVLGSSLYSGDITKVTTKELIQNAFDAVKDLGENGKIKVDLNPNGQSPYISVSDNGKGLSLKEIHTVFSDLGSSGKREDVNAAGGFGLAKAAPLLGGERAEVISYVKEPDGFYYRHQFEGTPDELLEGVNVKSERLEPNEVPETGTTVKTYFKPDSPGWYDATNMAENMAEKSYKFKGKLLRRSYYGSAKGYDFEHLGPDVKGADITNLENEHAKVSIIVPKGTKYGPSNGVPYDLLNNGLWQGRGHAGGWNELSGIPEKIFVDVQSKVPEGHTEYPFVANRESLRGSVEQLVNKYIDENIVRPAAGRRVEELQAVYNSLPSIKLPSGRDFHFYDVKSKYTPEELNAVITNPQFLNVAKTIDDTIHHALSTATEHVGWSEKLEKTGIIFDETVKGIHIPSPGTNKSAILINPLQLMSGRNPDQAATGLMHTILHEIAHIAGGGHDENFTLRLSELHDKYGAENTIRSIQNFLGAVASPEKDPLGGYTYKPELSEILSGYINARGRKGATIDPLYGTGIKSANRKSGGTGEIFESTRSGRADAASEFRNEIDRESAFERKFGEQPKEPTVNAIDAVYNFGRATSVGGDVSYALRQGSPYLAHSAYWKAIGPAIKAGFGEQAYAAGEASLREHPWYNVGERAGLFVADISDKLSKREEYIISNLPEKIPLIGRYFRGTNRANTLFLNSVRVNVFGQMMDAAAALGANLEEMAPKYAEHINNMTGHASLDFKGPKFSAFGKKIDLSVNAEKAAGPLSYLLFAPRFIASRLKMFSTFGRALAPVPDAWIGMDPVLRQESLRNLFALANIAIGSHILTKLNGGTVEDDPTSADYHKNKFGNTRFDPNAGLQQYIVLAARMITGMSKSTASGEKYQLGQKFRYQDRSDVAMRFLQNKSHPVINFSIELMRALHGNVFEGSTWKNARSYGKPFNLTTANPLENEIAKRFIPITIQDIYQVAKDNPKLIPVAAPLSVLGQGVQTYEP